MLYWAQQNTIDKRSTKEKTAFILVICLIILFLFSEAFVLTNSEHEHDHNGVGGNCAVCMQIYNTENLFKRQGMVIATLAFVLGSILAALTVYICVFLHAGYSSLAALKIRLNN